MCWDVVRESIIGGLLLMCYWIDSGEDHIGMNAKFIVLASAWIKLGGLVPYYLIVYALCRAKKLNVVYHGSYIAFIHLVYAPWSIYAMIRFFDGDNHTKDEAGFLYAGMLYLMIEGILVCLTALLLILVLSWLCVFFCFMYRSSRQLDQEQLERNQQISNLINQIDVLNITGKRFEADELCCIWLDNFDAEQDIIRLPCNRNHFFHRACINDWILKSPTCPLCKVEINEELLNQLSENGGFSEQTSKKSNYGGLENANAQPTNEIENNRQTDVSRAEEVKE